MSFVWGPGVSFKGSVISQGDTSVAVAPPGRGGLWGMGTLPSKSQHFAPSLVQSSRVQRYTVYRSHATLTTFPSAANVSSSPLFRLPIHKYFWNPDDSSNFIFCTRGRFWVLMCGNSIRLQSWIQEMVLTGPSRWLSAARGRLTGLSWARIRPHAARSGQ